MFRVKPWTRRYSSIKWQFSTVETMGGLETNFVTEGFWDYLGAHGKFANVPAVHKILIQHIRDIAKDAEFCELLRPWLHEQFLKQPWNQVLSYS